MNTHVRDCINIAYKYLESRTDKNLVVFQRQLQILTVGSDLRTFEPTTAETLELYICLQKFLTSSEGKSTNVAGKVLAFLAHVCESSTIRVALRDDIKIVPVLSNFLVNSKLSKDKALKSLSLLNTISYKLKIIRLEEWIIRLLPFLVVVITEGSLGDDAILIGLHILANLCRSNTPVVDCLLRLTNTKLLFTSLSRMKNATMDIKLLASEMLLLLNPKRNAMDSSNMDILDIIFTVTIEGFAENKVSWLQLAADVFEELMLLPPLENYLKEYKNYATHLQPLLSSIAPESSEPPNEAFLDLLCHLVEFEHPDIKSMHEAIFSRVIKWIHCERCGLAAMRVVKALLDAGSDTFTSASMDDLVKAVRISLTTGRDADLTHQELQRLVVILHLVEHICLSNEALGLKFAMEFEPSIFSHLLKKVLPFDTSCQGAMMSTDKLMTDSLNPGYVTMDSRYNLKANLRETLSQTITMIITVVKVLSSVKPEYMEEHRKMMETPAVMSHLVWCEQSGLSDYVSRAWSIVSNGRLPKECVDALVAASEKNPTRVRGTICGPELSISQTHMPALSTDLEEKLDTMIKHLGSSVEKMELKNCALTDVMEMYEFKLASMSHFEHSLQEALSAADKQNRLTHQCYLHTKVQNDHLRNLLATWETRFQTSQEEKAELQADIVQIQDSARQLRENFTNEKGQLERRNREMKKELMVMKNSLEASEENTRKLQRQLSDKGEEVKNLHKLIQEEQDKGIKLSNQIQKQEEELKHEAREVESLKKEVENLEKIRLQLKKENTDLELLVKSNEEAMAAKEEELEEANRKISKMLQIQNMIHDISSRNVLK